ncbi:hypothetical protein MTO96_009065 [Rhipicephalus appendiculatus]
MPGAAVGAPRAGRPVLGLLECTREDDVGCRDAAAPECVVFTVGAAASNRRVEPLTTLSLLNHLVSVGPSWHCRRSFLATFVTTPVLTFPRALRVT